MTAAVSARGLVKRYRGRAVLDRLDLEVAAGRAHGLCAPPGQGKTTLLRVLLDFVRADSGAAELLERPTRGLPAALRRRVGYLPQRPALAAELPLEGLLAARRAAAPGWDAELARRLSDAFALPAARTVSQLDRAARRGLELLLALAPRPALALLDDPFREEGAGGRAAAALAAVAAAGDTTLLVVADAPAGLQAVARDVTFAHVGRRLLTAPVDALLAQARAVRLPLDRYARVAAALGRAGVLSARTDELEKRVVVRRADAALEALLAAETEGAAEVCALDLDGVYRAATDVASTGTGTAP